MAAKFEDRSGARVATPQARGREPGIAHEATDPRAVLADTLPPRPLKELLSAGGATIFVLSTDTALIDTVQRAGGEQYPVFAVADWAELESAVASGRCGIALLDTELLGTHLVARIKALEAFASRLVTLVAADRAAAQELMGFLSDRRIHRLLIKPPALGITRLLIESAVTRCLQLRELAQDDGPVGEGRPRVSSVRRTTGMPAWVLVATAAALAVGVGFMAMSGWWRSSPAERSESLPAERSQSPRAAESGQAAQPAERFAELLIRAERAFGEGRLAAPPGDNALDYYLTILAVEPTQEVARHQLGLMIDALFAQAEEALLANALDTATETLASIRRADPTSSRLAFLEAQLERSRAAAAAPRQTAAAVAPSRPSPVAAEPTELDSLVTIAALRLQRGQLLEPRGDSAQEYIDRAAQLSPRDPRVAAIRAELVAALAGAAGVSLERAKSRLRTGALLEPAGDSAIDHLARLQGTAPDTVGLSGAWDEFVEAVSGNARAAIAARNWSSAEAQLAALQQAPHGSMVAAPLLELLNAGRLQEQYLAKAVPASELALLTAVSPVYPVEAQRRNVEGWVDLEFVVDRAGRPKDLVVLRAEPEARFDQAALQAVGQYRYVPFERDGRVFERRVRLRVRFTLE